MEILKEHKITDYWTIIFAIISLVLANLAVFIPSQRLLILSFTILSVIFAIIFYYVNKLKNYEGYLDSLASNLQEISKQVIEKFNYLKEIYNLKIEIEMLKSKNKKAELSLLDLLKAIIAIIFIYVIVQIIKSFFAG